MLAKLFGIDVRSLALFRVGLGLLLLVDLGVRATDLVAHYTDAGVLPRDTIQHYFTGTGRWSIHMLSGSVGFQAAMFGIAAIAAASLTIGCFTRLATCVSWVLLVSLQNRNPILLNGGDILLRVLLLWSMFLPLGAVWSVDSRRRRTPITSPVVSMASAAILLQVAIVYFVTGFLKYRGGWGANDCLARILEFDGYARPLAERMLQYPELLSWFGWLVLWSELVLPWLLFSPVFTRPIRLAAIMLFAAFHLAIELTLTVGLFSYVSWLAWTLFLPESWWDWLARWKQPIAATTDRDGPVFAPHSGARPIGIALGVVVATLFAFTVCWNVTTVKRAWSVRADSVWSHVANVTALRQRWDMFWSPPRRDGWFVIVARLSDGQTIDLLRDGAAADWDSYRKPEHVYRQFPNHRWRKLFRRLTSDAYAAYRDPLCRYLAHAWDATHTAEQSVREIELQFMQERGDEVDRFQQRFLCTVALKAD